MKFYLVVVSTILSLSSMAYANRPGGKPPIVTVRALNVAFAKAGLNNLNGLRSCNSICGQLKTNGVPLIKELQNGEVTGQSADIVSGLLGRSVEITNWNDPVAQRNALHVISKASSASNQGGSISRAINGSIRELSGGEISRTDLMRTRAEIEKNCGRAA